MRKTFTTIAALLLAAHAHSSVWAAEAQIAVAANFAEPIKAIAAVLEKTTGHKLKISTGASGAFVTQIKNGAPYDMFFSADKERPEILEKEGLTQPGSRFTYAHGRLALWSSKVGRVDNQGAVLNTIDLGKVAFANPKTAPYGAAAVQVMETMGLSDSLASRLVQGESIGQTFNFVRTGNADVGFVALSQILEGGQLKSGSMWIIPLSHYRTIQQDAVILKRGQHNEAAQALAQLLQSPAIQELIRSYGYGT